MAAVPRVSIVLATYNQATWLGRTIASVRAQRFADWELLVVDDGSTDDTAAVVAATGDDARIHYLPGPRRERAAARNRGLRAARGEFVSFLDGDDLWEPDKLARQVATLDARADAGLCYTVARFVDETDRPLPIRKPPRLHEGWVFPASMRANFMILSSVMARRTLVAEVGGFDETLDPLGCEDWDLWLRLARRAPCCAVPDELTRYRIHGANTPGAQVLASGLRVVERHYALPETARAAGMNRATAVARLLWYHAGATAGANRPEAFRLAGRALRGAPLAALSRPGAGALLALCLPAGVRRWLTRSAPPVEATRNRT